MKVWFLLRLTSNAKCLHLSWHIYHRHNKICARSQFLWFKASKKIFWLKKERRGIIVKTKTKKFHLFILDPVKSSPSFPVANHHCHSCYYNFCCYCSGSWCSAVRNSTILCLAVYIKVGNMKQQLSLLVLWLLLQLMQSGFTAVDVLL